jgi:TM2 domain-containing membrane protein YozV
MKFAGRSILLAPLLMYLLSADACASTSGLPDDLSSGAILSQPRDQPFSFLFAQQAVDSTQPHSLPSLKLKSPYMAAFYSVIPGVLVHGSGHFYAGKEGTGSALLGLEAAGVLLLYFGSLSAFQGSSHQNDTDAMGYIGLALFAGSWVYDMVGSPIAVVRRNRYIKETEGTQYDFKREPRQLRLTFAWHFSL